MMREQSKEKLQPIEARIPSVHEMENLVVRPEKRARLTTEGKQLAKAHWDMLVRGMDIKDMSSKAMSERVGEYMDEVKDHMGEFGPLLKQSLDARVRHMREQEKWAEVKASGSPWREVAEMLTIQQGTTREAALSRTFKQLAEVKGKIQEGFAKTNLVDESVVMAMETRVAKETMKLLQTENDFTKKQLEETNGDVDKIVKLAIATDLNADRNLDEGDVYELLALDEKQKLLKTKPEPTTTLSHSEIEMAVEKPKKPDNRLDLRTARTQTIQIATALTAAFGMVFANPSNGENTTKASWPEERKPTKTATLPNKRPTATPAEARKPLPTATIEFSKGRISEPEQTVTQTITETEPIIDYPNSWNVGGVDMHEKLHIKGNGVDIDLEKFAGPVYVINSEKDKDPAYEALENVNELPGTELVMDTNYENNDVVILHSGGRKWPAQDLRKWSDKDIGDEIMINGKKFRIADVNMVTRDAFRLSQRAFKKFDENGQPTQEWHERVGYAPYIVLDDLGIKGKKEGSVVLITCTGTYKDGEYDHRQVIQMVPEE